MFQAYAEILGRHAADAVRRMTGLKLKHIEVVSEPVTVSHEPYQTAIFINFFGRLKDKKIRGYCVFGFGCNDDARPIAQAVAECLGLSPKLAENMQGIYDILSELLNVIIGLTGAGWSDQDLDISFDPPDIHTGETLPPVAPNAQTYKTTIEADKDVTVNIITRFILEDN